MKKVLYATTALVGTAGVAAADVSLSGWAEMGVFGTDTIETQFFQDIDVTFTLSGTTDNGLTFGAVVDLDENGAFAPASHGGSSIFISGNFGTLTMGDTDGALDWALTEAGNVGNPGSLADDETIHAGYNGSYGDPFGDGQVLRYDNTFGDFGVAVSFAVDDAGVNDLAYAVGFKYTLALGGVDVNLGAGYQQAYVTPAAVQTLQNTTLPVAAGADVDIWGVSASADFAGGFSAGIVYSDWEFNGINPTTHVGVGLGYASGPISIHANWGEFDVTGFGKFEGYGLAAAYDLGGGASVKAGYGGSSTPAGFVVDDTWSLGLALSF